MASKPDIPGWKYLGGKSRRYENIATGATISRREYDKMRGIIYEQKAAENKAKDLVKALSRPAPGRVKAAGQVEAEIRAEAFKEKQVQKNLRVVERKAAQQNKRIRVKKIRPQLLKSGTRATRIPFTTYEEYLDLRKQMLEQKLPNGKRLVSWYSIGIHGIDERDGRDIDATIFKVMSPSYKIERDEFEAETDDFILERLYFIFSHYWIHLHYDAEYAESRMKKARLKNLR